MIREWFGKARNAFRHSAASWIFGLLPRTAFNYEREVGKGFGSSVVMAPVKFIQRVFPEAPLRLKRSSSEDYFPVHPFLDLTSNPNRFYGGNALWRATIAAYILDGNAYWYKARNEVMDPVELWWLPPWQVRPISPMDGSAFITHYEYRPQGGEVIEISPNDLVHFRNGLDPRDPRLGLSDLHSVLREVFSDDEASNFTASILRNMGVPGVVISPKAGAIDEKTAAAAEARFARRFGGDMRGSVMAMRGPTDVHQFAWSPAQLELSSVRDVSEERVCAVLGVPAAVVGFGSGLQQTKVGATMTELIKLAWIAAIIPMQHAMAGDLAAQLLPEFVSYPKGYQVYFDDAQVTALQESETERTRRLNMAWLGGWAKRSEARRALRLPVTDEDDVYIGDIRGGKKL